MWLAEVRVLRTGNPRASKHHESWTCSLKFESFQLNSCGMKLTGSSCYCTGFLPSKHLVRHWEQSKRLIFLKHLTFFLAIIKTYKSSYAFLSFCVGFFFRPNQPSCCYLVCFALQWACVPPFILAVSWQRTLKNGKSNHILENQRGKLDWRHPATLSSLSHSSANTIVVVLFA